MTSVSVDAVIVGDRHRHVDQARVDALAASITDLGLQHPISVWIETRGDDFDVHLVAGLHRLEAAKKLGWADIEAVEVTLDETRRELWEIDENLMRSELTDNEKREHLRRRKKLWDKSQAERQNQVGHHVPPEIGYRKPPPQSRGFAADTADKTGMSKRQINRLLAEPKPKPVQPPTPAHNPDEAFNQWCGQMNRLWSRAPQDWRERWLEQNDQPVFDAARSA